jgi:hypothetical protein
LVSAAFSFLGRPFRPHKTILPSSGGSMFNIHCAGPVVGFLQRTVPLLWERRVRTFPVSPR